MKWSSPSLSTASHAHCITVWGLIVPNKSLFDVTASPSPVSCFTFFIACDTFQRSRDKDPLDVDTVATCYLLLSCWSLVCHVQLHFKASLCLRHSKHTKHCARGTRKHVIKVFNTVYFTQIVKWKGHRRTHLIHTLVKLNTLTVSLSYR